MRKNILTILFAACALLCGCEVHEDTFFDIPYTYISDAGGQYEMIVDNTLDNLLTELTLHIDLSAERFTEPVTVSLDIIVGDGLKEGVDFRIQASSKGPVTFVPGVYSMPVRVIWMRHELDPSKDNSLTFSISGCSYDDMLIGLPGPDSLNSAFRFIKQ